mgnify:CR=1 FL=1
MPLTTAGDEQQELIVDFSLQGSSMSRQSPFDSLMSHEEQKKHYQQRYKVWDLSGLKQAVVLGLDT